MMTDFFKNPDARCMRNKWHDIPHDPGPTVGRDEEYMYAICLDCGKKIMSKYQNVATVSQEPWLALFVVKEWP